MPAISLQSENARVLRLVRQADRDDVVAALGAETVAERFTGKPGEIVMLPEGDVAALFARVLTYAQLYSRGLNFELQCEPHFACNSNANRMETGHGSKKSFGCQYGIGESDADDGIFSIYPINFRIFLTVILSCTRVHLLAKRNAVFVALYFSLFFWLLR